MALWQLSLTGYQITVNKNQRRNNLSSSWYSSTPEKAGVRPNGKTRRRNKNYAPSRLARYSGVWPSGITKSICVGHSSTIGRLVAIRFGRPRRQLRLWKRGGRKYLMQGKIMASDVNKAARMNEKLLEKLQQEGDIG